ncbi:MAG: Uma2 family endonuclease [Alphaproteobacteria bacterium]|nr:Uma2 family endonuclease [Alphaproteobacteria bacterium]
MTAAARPRMTLAAFLAWDDGTDQRYELLDGEIIAVAPPSEAHGTIVQALGRSIGNALKRPCRVVGEAGVLVPGRRDSFFVPDLVVTCAPPRPGAQHVEEPILVVEVLSPSTLRHGLQNKLHVYRQIPSVKEILYVSSFERHVELQRRGAGLWTVQDLIGDSRFRLESVGAEIDLAAIYQDVALAGDAA